MLLKVVKIYCSCNTVEGCIEISAVETSGEYFIDTKYVDCMKYTLYLYSLQNRKKKIVNFHFLSCFS